MGELDDLIQSVLRQSIGPLEHTKLYEITVYSWALQLENQH